MNLPVAILIGVFLLIAFRRIGGIPVKIWQAMLGGAMVILLTGQLDPLTALEAIDWDVMVFLFGMFVVGEALIMSGYLGALAYRGLHNIRSAEGLVLAILLGGGIGSAILMNDTLAIVGTPLVLRLAREHRLEPRLLLMALAVAITTGSVMSPIGNPQNLLIAVGGPVPSPFLTFIQYLALPTLISLAWAFLVLRLMMPKAFHAEPLTHSTVPVTDPSLAGLARAGILIILLCIIIKMARVVWGWEWEIPLSAIAILAAAPLLIFSPKRILLLRKLDWPTLIFFAAMFVLMGGVWQTGTLQDWTARLHLDLNAIPSIMGLSILLSQFISNVPLVALYLPFMSDGQQALPALMTLAAGSTIAGNLLILGAASNVIIIQRAEQEGQTISFLTFARIGLPLTLLQSLTYGLYLHGILS
jgi:Na+/H+ antiporter NhaD/arsenite permease-like protein